NGIVTREEPMRNDVGGQDVDVGWKLVIHAPAQRFRRQRRADVEVRDLGERMNAGIGAARSVQLEIFAPRYGARCSIEFALHGPGVLLDLPAAVPRARVFDGQFEARHSRSGRSGRSGRSVHFTYPTHPAYLPYQTLLRRGANRRAAKVLVRLAVFVDDLERRTPRPDADAQAHTSVSIGKRQYRVDAGAPAARDARFELRPRPVVLVHERETARRNCLRRQRLRRGDARENHDDPETYPFQLAILPFERLDATCHCFERDPVLNHRAPPCVQLLTAATLKGRVTFSITDSRLPTFDYWSRFN